MGNTYPVAGYRTAEAARRGFQTFEERFLSQSFRSPSSPSARDLEALLQQAFRPSAPGTPIRTGAGASIIPKVARGAATVGMGAVTRHPVFRAAQLAWDAQHFLSEAASVQQTEEDAAGALTAAGWSACVQCRSDPSHQQYDTSSNCALTKCYSNQWATTQGAYGDPIPSTTRRLTLWTYQWWDSFGRYSVASEWVRPGTGAMPENWHLVTTGSTQLVPQRTPMPMPYSLIPHQPQTSTHSSGYGEPPAPPTKFRRHKPVRHRKPGRKESERKFKIMSGGRLRNLVEAAFEGTEWVADLHDALPDDCKAKGFSTVAQKAVAVIGCFHRLDMCKAVENRINNHIEDKMIGVLGQFGKWNAQGSGKSYGLAGITKKLGKPYFDENGDLQFDPTLPFSIPRVSLGC